MAKDFTYVYNPVKETKGNENSRVEWSTQSINIALDAIKKGLPLKQTPFANKNTNLLRPELVYRRTQEEIEDYIHCMQDVKYFATKCFLMTPEGLQAVKLRDYQLDYLDHLSDSRFSIFLSCRQSGKCLLMTQKCKTSTNISKKSYHLNDNTYITPLYEIYNIVCKQTIWWKIEYQLYKLIDYLQYGGQKRYATNEVTRGKSKIAQILQNNLVYILINIISLIDKFQYGNSKDKFVESYDLNDVEVLTDSGFKPVSHIHLTKPFSIYNIILDNGYHLECADNHIVFDKDFNEIFVKDLSVGDYIQTDNGISKVNQIAYNDTKVSMCDLSINDENHRYYTNGILSHNSTTTAIYCLWYILFNTDVSGLILSKSGPAGVDLISKIKDMFLHLPYYLKPGIYKWNQHEIAFDNNSNVHTEAFSTTAGLGQTINFLILDEFAWTPPNETELFYNNVIPTVTTIPNSKVCIMSTQNGFNFFYKLWNNAITGESAYKPFKVDWNQVPNWNPEKKCWEKRDEKWKKMMIGVLGGEAAFYYQYGTQFSASDKCLISRIKISDIRDKAKLFIQRPMGLADCEDHIYWREDFDFEQLKTGFFIVLVDIAEGGGNDYTVFDIIQMVGKDQFKQVGYWRANDVRIERAVYEFWMMTAQLFNNERCLISIEWNTYGALFYRLLLDMNEDDMFPEYQYRFNYAQDGIDENNIISYNRNMNDNQVDMKITKSWIPGIKFSSANKITACSMLKMYIENDQIDIEDLVTVTELENFEDKTGSGSYKAAFGHDDIIMTIVQLPMVMQTPSYKSLVEDFELANSLTVTYDGNDEYGFNDYFNNPLEEDSLRRRFLNG